MKILYVCRLYSGFEDSIKNGVWEPKGAPTIARMIEHLSATENNELHILFTQKGANHHDYAKTIKIAEIKAHITILKGSASLPEWLWKFKDKLSEIDQFCRIFLAYKKFKPDIVYCDRANIFSAALLSRFTNARVIWRVMGVLQIMHNAANEKTLRSAFLRFLWRSPFAHVICTIDGSDGEPWLKHCLGRDVPYSMLLNGIDKDLEPDAAIALPADKTKILFVGRLEPMKGTNEFLEAFAELTKRTPNLHAVIAGDGSLLETMKQQVRQNGIADHVSFLGSLTPAQLKYVRQNCDFYVSLNTHGNLTNVNLEALSDGLPTIIPTSDPEHGIDSDTDKFIPDHVFYRFGKVGDTDALVKAMLFMTDELNRALYRKNSETFAKEFLPSWDERVAQEIKIYEQSLGDDLTVVISDLGSGGAQKVAVSLVDDLAKTDQKISLITLDDGAHDFYTLPDNIKRIALNLNQNSANFIEGIFANFKRIVILRRTLKRLSPKKTLSFIAPTNILTIAAGIGLNTKTIISERNDPARQSFGKLWDNLRKISYRFANTVTANSPNAIETLKTYVPEKKLVFIPNALVKPKKKYCVSMSQKEKIILIVGRLHPQKAHHVLLDAFAKIYPDHPDWSLMIVGEGSLRQTLENQATALAISERVHFEGVQDNPYDYYARAQIFVLPSLHEGTPNSLLEAISCGVAPIISDACEGAKPYVENNVSGLIFPVNDSDALALTLKTLIDNESVRKKIGLSAQEKVRILFEKTTADLWDEVLNS